MLSHFLPLLVHLEYWQTFLNPLFAFILLIMFDHKPKYLEVPLCPCVLICKMG